MARKAGGRARRRKRSVGLNRVALLGVFSAGEDERGIGAVREVLFGEVEAWGGGRDLWVRDIGGWPEVCRSPVVVALRGALPTGRQTESG